MDDLMSKIQAMLSDEESMNQIKQLAEMFGTGTGAAPQENAPSQPAQPSPAPDLSALLSGLTGGGQGSSGTGGLDMGMLLQLQSLFSTVSAGDKNSELLLALKPILKEDKHEKIDKAIKILKLLALWSVVKESGLLKSLDLF